MRKFCYKNNKTKKLTHPDKFKGYADDNETFSFKNRNIDLTKPIRIFRNLSKKGIWYSIMQDRKVVAHSKALCIRNCKFIVSEKGRLRVIKNKRKEFHAYIEGYYSPNGMGTSSKRNDLPVEIKYNPYKNNNFICFNLTLKPFIINSAMFVICNSEGVKAVYTN